MLASPIEEIKTSSQLQVSQSNVSLSFVDFISGFGLASEEPICKSDIKTKNNKAMSQLFFTNRNCLLMTTKKIDLLLI